MKIMEVKCMERTEAQKEYAVAAALRTAQGRNEIGQTMLEPFKQGRDYVGIGRKETLRTG